MKALVATFNQEKALVGAFSVITNLRMELFEALIITLATFYKYLSSQHWAHRSQHRQPDTWHSLHTPAPGACTEGALWVLQGSWYFPTADLDNGKSPSHESWISWTFQNVWDICINLQTRPWMLRQVDASAHSAPHRTSWHLSKVKIVPRAGQRDILYINLHVSNMLPLRLR